MLGPVEVILVTRGKVTSFTRYIYSQIVDLPVLTTPIRKSLQLHIQLTHRFLPHFTTSSYSHYILSVPLLPVPAV